MQLSIVSFPTVMKPYVKYLCQAFQRILSQSIDGKGKEIEIAIVIWF